MKNFIIKNGRAVIDISAYFLLAIIVIAGVMGMFQGSFLYGLIGLVLALVGFFITYFFIYLLIDMRDTLKVIAEQNGKKE
ncbi:MAG: hypothetical protein IKH45_03760 [Neisseriaceae bacterium]|nr:hypothetical protein [Neisseriaceae bacterium]